MLGVVAIMAGLMGFLTGMEGADISRRGGARPLRWICLRRHLPRRNSEARRTLL